MKSLAVLEAVQCQVLMATPLKWGRVVLSADCRAVSAHKEHSLAQQKPGSFQMGPLILPGCSGRNSEWFYTTRQRQVPPSSRAGSEWLSLHRELDKVKVVSAGIRIEAVRGVDGKRLGAVRR